MGLSQVIDALLLLFKTERAVYIEMLLIQHNSFDSIIELINVKTALEQYARKYLLSIWRS